MKDHGGSPTARDFFPKKTSKTTVVAVVSPYEETKKTTKSALSKAFDQERHTRHRDKTNCYPHILSYTIWPIINTIATANHLHAKCTRAEIMGRQKIVSESIHIHHRLGLASLVSYWLLTAGS